MDTLTKKVATYSMHKIKTYSSNSTPKIISSPKIYIGPESDHLQRLSLTDSLTNWLTHSLLFGKLVDVTLACEDGNSNLVEVVTVVDVDDEKQFTP